MSSAKVIKNKEQRTEWVSELSFNQLPKMKIFYSAKNYLFKKFYCGKFIPSYITIIIFSPSCEGIYLPVINLNKKKSASCL